MLKICTVFVLLLSSTILHCFYLSRQLYRCKNFQYFGQNIEIFWKKYSLAYHLAETGTYPDLPKLFRSDWIWIHITASNYIYIQAGKGRGCMTRPFPFFNILSSQASRPATVKNKTFPILVEMEQNQIYTFSNLAGLVQNELSVKRLERETCLRGFNVSHTNIKACPGQDRTYIRFKQHKKLSQFSRQCTL
jgi:hypothetical protein